MPNGFLSKFFSQPDELPTGVRDRIAASLPDESIMAYAFCDLDPQARYGSAWLAVTARNICLDDGHSPSLKILRLEDVDKFELFDGITNSRMNVVSKAGTLAMSVQYSRRQARAVGNLQFIAEQTRKALLEGKETKDLSADFDPGSEYAAAMIESVEEAKASLSMPRSGVIARLLGYLKPHRKTFIIGLTASVMVTLVQLVAPLLTKAFIDRVVTPLQQAKAPVDGPWHVFWLILSGFAFVFLSTALFSFVRLRIMAIVGEKISMKLREDVYNHMQKLSLAFFSKHPTGSLITRVSSDTDRLWDFVTFGVLDIIVSILMLAGVAVMLLVQNWRLALLVLVPIPFITWLFYWHSKGIQVLFLRIWRKWSSMTAVLSDVIPGMRVVKAFAREKFEEDRFKQKNMAVQDEAILLHKNWTTFWPSVEFLMRACTLIVWLVGAPMVLRNAQHSGAGMTLGMFMAFVNYMWMFWGPVEHLGMMSRSLNRVTTSASRIFEVLDTVPSIVSKPEAARVEPLQGRVVFEDAAFTYDGIRNVLKGVSFDVSPGEMIGLVGPSGGGKTTLVNLICRFYDVKSGRILIDGVDVRDHDLGLLRRQIGVVLQEPYLFHGTIAENIAYGSQNKGLKDIIDAAKAAHAHEFVCRFRDGYETVVGERGQTLSGGERQRISIARAILHDPRILILDEATSSVDTETEKKIQDALRHLVAGRTTFAIAHRLSTLSKADRLFVLEECRLVEHGTHGELLNKPDGVYAKLHKTQMELHATIAV